jgi:hypothetical protein
LKIPWYSRKEGEWWSRCIYGLDKSRQARHHRETKRRFEHMHVVDFCGLMATVKILKRGFLPCTCTDIQADSYPPCLLYSILSYKVPTRSSLNLPIPKSISYIFPSLRSLEKSAFKLLLPSPNHLGACNFLVICLSFFWLTVQHTTV